MIIINAYVLHKLQDICFVRAKFLLAKRGVLYERNHRKISITIP